MVLAQIKYNLNFNLCFENLTLVWEQISHLFHISKNFVLEQIKYNLNFPLSNSIIKLNFLIRITKFEN